MNISIAPMSGAVLTAVLCFGSMSGAVVPTASPDLTPDRMISMVGRSSLAAITTVPLTKLPPEAKTTIGLIERGGPFPYPQKDGTVFGNFEKRLPIAARSYYREYTVPTPGARNRGARRIIASQQREYYYTGDHYATFAKIQLPTPKR